MEKSNFFFRKSQILFTAFNNQIIHISFTALDRISKNMGSAGWPSIVRAVEVPRGARACPLHKCKSMQMGQVHACAAQQRTHTILIEKRKIY